jgi:hypothetical protein
MKMTREFRLNVSQKIAIRSDGEYQIDSESLMKAIVMRKVSWS